MCLAFWPIFVITHVKDDVGHFTFSIKFIVPHAGTDEGPFRKEINILTDYIILANNKSSEQNDWKSNLDFFSGLLS